MSASFASALAAARDASASQDYPGGALYVMATPIGNLSDITLRALYVLQVADVIACEDTRHTQALLRAYGIDKPSSGWMAVHRHNEAGAADAVVDRLRQGQRVVYASDAGTPAVSDPGARLVAAARAAGFRVVPLPGASSVTAVLSVSGIADGDAAFVFAGFLPAKAGERDAFVAALAGEARAVVLLEAPHRVETFAQAMAALGSRAITVGRELTKQFEEIATLRCEALPAWFAADARRVRGEFALVLHPAPVAAAVGEGERVLRVLLAELPLKTAVKLAAEISGESRNALYDAALKLKE